MFFGLGHPGRQMAGMSARSKLLASASVSLDFMTPGVLDPRITFSRAAVGTYIDSAGVMQTAAVDTPRWDYDPGTKQLRGLPIEEARTNTLINSDTRNPGGTTVASTDVPLLKPEATQWKHTWSGGNGPILSTNIPLTASTAYAISYWVYIPSAYDTSVDGTIILNADLNGGVGTGGGTLTGSADMTKRDQWQRIVTITTIGTAPGATLMNALLRRSAPTTGGSIFYCCCPQVEVGSFASSYIPAGATATQRNSDMVAITGTNFSSWYNPTAGTFATEATLPFTLPAGLSVFPRHIEVSDGSTANNMNTAVDFAQTRIAFQTIVSSAINGQALMPGLPAANALAKITASYGTDIAVCTNVAGTPSSVVRVAGALPPGMIRINIGNRPDALRSLNGYMRRLRYWPRALSDAEMQSVTS